MARNKDLLLHHGLVDLSDYSDQEKQELLQRYKAEGEELARSPHPDVQCRSVLNSTTSRNNWRTPSWFYSLCDQEFDFTMDVCANLENTQHWNYYSLDERGEDALILPWSDRNWMNCPYSNTPKFLEKSFFEAVHGKLTAGLIASRPGTRYWYDYVAQLATEIRFIVGRLHFDDGKDPAPFDSATVIFDPNNLQPTGGAKHVYWDCIPKKRRKKKDI